MNDLLARLDQHEAARAGAPATPDDLAFYTEIAAEALRRLQAVKGVQMPVEEAVKLLAEKIVIDNKLRRLSK